MHWEYRFSTEKITPYVVLAWNNTWEETKLRNSYLLCHLIPKALPENQTHCRGANLAISARTAHALLLLRQPQQWDEDQPIPVNSFSSLHFYSATHPKIPKKYFSTPIKHQFHFHSINEKIIKGIGFFDWSQPLWFSDICSLKNCPLHILI